MEHYEKANRAIKRVRELFPGLRASHAKEALSLGLVTRMDGKRVAKGERGAFGISTTLLVNHLQKLKTPDFKPDIAIVAETTDWWVIDKPAGIPSHPISLLDTRTITHWAFSRWPWLMAEFQELQPTITPHRLDTGTSGILIVAKNRRGFASWRERFAKKGVSKTYLAWCWGVPSHDYFEINTPLLTSHRRRVIASPLGRPAESCVTVKQREDGYFLCEITTNTGVTHQIRAHMSFSGFPLLGDRSYDDIFESRPIRFDYHCLRAIAMKSLPFQYALLDSFPLPNAPHSS